MSESRGEQQVEQETHAAKAERLMDAAVENREEELGLPASEGLLVSEAQVHADLAIAQQLEQLNNSLTELFGDGSKLDRIMQGIEAMDRRGR